MAEVPYTKPHRHTPYRYPPNSNIFGRQQSAKDHQWRCSLCGFKMVAPDGSDVENLALLNANQRLLLRPRKLLDASKQVDDF